MQILKFIEHKAKYLFLISIFPVLMSQGFTQCEYYCLNPPTYYTDGGNPGTVYLSESIADDLVNLGVKIGRVEVIRKIYYNSPDIDYTAYDQIINRLTSRGIKVMLLIDYQTVGQDSGNWNDSLDSSTTNGYIRDFQTKLAEIANHYKGQVNYWEIWNESNICVSGYCPYLNTTTFAALLRTSYDTLKSIDTGNMVITGGLGTIESTGTTSRNYMNSVYDTSIFSTYRVLNGNYPMDFIGYHPYVYPASLVSTNILRFYSSVTLHNDIGRKLWITELGWPTQGTNGITESAQSTYLHQIYQNLNNLSMGTTKIIDQLFWFNYQDSSGASLYFGLLREDNSRKPSYYAYQSMATTVSCGSTIFSQDTTQIDVILNATQWYTCCTSFPDYMGDKAFDGIIDVSSTLSKWATGEPHDVYGDDTVRHWLVVDLGTTYTVNSIVCWNAPTEPNYVQTELADLQKGTSFYGPWTTIGTIDQRPLGVGNYEERTVTPFSPPETIRYLRFITTFVNSAHPPNVGYLDTYVRLSEMQVWADNPAIVPVTDWQLYQ